MEASSSIIFRPDRGLKLEFADYSHATTSRISKNGFMLIVTLIGINFFVFSIQFSVEKAYFFSALAVSLISLIISWSGALSTNIRGNVALRSISILCVCVSFGLCLIGRVINGDCRSDNYMYTWGCNPSHESRNLPMDSVIILMLFPLMAAVVARTVPVEVVLVSWLIAVGSIVIALCVGEMYQSIPSLVYYVPISCLLIFETRRQHLSSFISTYEQTSLLSENERKAEETHATELRHMIGNVAHDLKTPLSAFLGGIEFCVHEILELEQSTQGLTEEQHRKIGSIKDSLHDVQNVNNFMIMTINRCIDFTKASKGVKLVPKLDTIDLNETLRLPLGCVKEMQTKFTFNSDMISSDICSHIITDQQWLQENILCLLSNAVKYSSKGDITVKLYLTDHSMSGMMFGFSTKLKSRGLQPTTHQRTAINNQKFARQGKALSRMPSRLARNLSAHSINTAFDDDMTVASTMLKPTPKSYKVGDTFSRIWRIHPISSNSNSAINSNEDDGSINAEHCGQGSHLNSPKHGRVPKTPTGAGSTNTVNILKSIKSAITPTVHLSRGKTHQTNLTVITASSGISAGDSSMNPGESAAPFKVTDPNADNSPTATKGRAGSVCSADYEDEIFAFNAPAHNTAAGEVSITSISDRPHRAPSDDDKSSDKNSVSFTERAFKNMSHALPSIKYRTGTASAGVPEPDSEDMLLMIEIEDTGIGIAPETMHKLFSPFRQAQRMAGGTGLGLYSLAKRMEAIGGYYGVQGRRDGKQGSLFWFAIPYRPDHETARMKQRLSVNFTSPDGSRIHTAGDNSLSIMSINNNNEISVMSNSSTLQTAVPRVISPAIVSPPESVKLSSHQRPSNITGSLFDLRSASSDAGILSRSMERSVTILLVDDASTILKFTTQVLKKQGYEVDQAVNGAEALEMMQQRRYDAVLMDLQMPVMDGLEATRRIRHHEMTKLKGKEHQFIIGLSANSDSVTREESFAAGVDAFIAKPFRVDIFVDMYHKHYSKELTDLLASESLEGELAPQQ